jgi:hypothetical protein
MYRIFCPSSNPCAIYEAKKIRVAIHAVAECQFAQAENLIKSNKNGTVQNGNCYSPFSVCQITRFWIMPKPGSACKRGTIMEKANKQRVIRAQYCQLF